LTVLVSVQGCRARLSTGRPRHIGSDADAEYKPTIRLLEGLRLARLLWSGKPVAPDADQWGHLWNEVKEIARTVGRDPNALTGAMYLTVVTEAT
jgi:hypothetical protein